MPENASVGRLTLDLVIRGKLEEQLEKIKTKVSAPAEKVGEAIEEAIEKPVKEAGKAVADSVNKAMDEANKAVRTASKKTADSAGKALKDAESAFEQFEEQLKSANGRMEAQLMNAVAKLEELKKKWLDLASNDGDSPQLINIEQQIISTMNTIDKLEEKINKTVNENTEKIKKSLSDAAKFDIGSEPAARLKQEIELLTEKLSLLQKKYQELSAADPSDKIAAQMNRVKQQIISTQERLDKLRAKQAEYGASSNSAVEETVSAFSRISSAASKAGGSISSVLGKAFNYVKSAGGKALSALSSRFKGVAKSAADVMKPVRKLGKTLKNAFRRVFLLAGIYAAFRALKDGFLAAAKADEEFNKSLNEVKANLAIAFAPIMQAIMPALNSLMSGLAAVTRQIAAFIAGLFGTTYKQAAQTAQKLKGVTDAAKKAKMATAGIDEMNILSSGGDDSDSSSGIDYSKIDMSEPELPEWAELLKKAIKKGDWYGVGKIFAERVNSAFGSINWDSISAKVDAGVRKVTDSINGFLDNVSWETLGDTVAGGLNTITGAIDTFYKTVKWDKLGGGIARGLNQAIRKTKWKQLGSAFAGGLQAMIETAFAFVKEFDFEGFGSGIGDAVNGWFERIDFGMAAQTLSMGLIGVFNTVTAVFQRTNFDGIGKKIAAFFNNVDIAGILGSLARSVSSIVSGALTLLTSMVEHTDWFILGEKIFDGIGAALKNIKWNKLVSQAFELLGAAVGGALSLAVGLLGKVFDLLVKAYKKVKSYFKQKTEECGGNLIAGVFLGILEALANVGHWIQEHIFKPFIDGFKKAFGIHSPSKEMAKLGGYLIDGLYNAVAGGISRIKSIFTDMLKAIKSVFDGVKGWFKDKFTKAADGVKEGFGDVGDWFGKRWEDIKGTFSDAKERFSEKFSEASKGAKEGFKDVGGWFSDRYDDIKGVFRDVGGFFSRKFSDAFRGIKSTLGNWRSWFQSRVNDITDVFSSLPDKLEKIFETARDKISDVWEDIKDGASDVMDKLTGSDSAVGKIASVGGIGGLLSKIPFFANGGELSTGSAIVGEAGPELLSMINGRAKVTPLVNNAPPLTLIGNRKSSGSLSGADISTLRASTGISDTQSLAEIAALIREIIRLLKSGISADIIGDIFGTSFKRLVLKIIAEDKTRRGG